MRQSTPVIQFQLPERCYCADIVYPMAIVGTAQRGILCYQLDSQPREYKVGHKFYHGDFNAKMFCYLLTVLFTLSTLIFSQTFSENRVSAKISSKEFIDMDTFISSQLI